MHDEIDTDDLAPARGILLGMVLGAFMWAAIGVAICLW